MFTSKARRLLIIGGAADTCFVEFLKLAGGKHAKIIVLGHASGSPRQAAESVKASLVSLGATQVKVLTPRSGGNIDADVDAIFMSGGDQERLVKLADKLGLSEQIREACRRGVLIGGTSAGAAACAPVMICGGMSDGVLKRDSLLLGKGLCLLPNIIVDTHFAQRNRFNRLRAAVATLDDTIAVGLDEDTALAIEGNAVRVVGAGNVYVCSRDQNNPAADWETIANASLLGRLEKAQSYVLSNKQSVSIQ